MKVRNTFFIFLVSGFWHGANWTFIVWGGLNALYFLPLLILKRNRTNLGVVAEGRMLPSLRELWQMGSTFLLTVLAWIFFRSNSVVSAKGYFGKMFSESFFTSPYFPGIGLAKETVGFVLVMLFIEWINRGKRHSLMNLPRINLLRYFYYMTLIFWVISNFGPKQDFIYFQF